MDTEVLAGLTNKFPPSDSPLTLNLVRPKILEEVSCRNTELPVEMPVASYRKPRTSSVFVLSDPPNLQCPSYNLQLVNGN